MNDAPPPVTDPGSLDRQPHVAVGEKLYWSDAELAELLGISVRLLQQSESAGLLPEPERWGRRKLWRAATIREWVRLGRPSRERFEKMQGGAV